MWRKLTFLGINREFSIEKKRKIIFLNRINLILLILFFMVALFDIVDLFYKGKTFSLGLVAVYILVLLCGFHLFLNSRNLYHVSRVLLLFDVPLILLYFAPLTDTAWKGYFLWGPYAPISFSIAVYFIYTEKNEVKYLLYALGLYLLMAITYDFILLNIPSRDSLMVEIVKENYIFYKLPPILCFVFINLSMYYSFSHTRKYLERLNKSKEKMTLQKIELAHQNKQLKKANATKNKFFRIIGHDLKSPISLILQFSNLIEQKLDTYSKEKILKHNDIIKNAAKRSLALLSELLTWARSQTESMIFSPEVLNLHEIVRDNLMIYGKNAESKEIKLINEVDEEIVVNADLNMLNSIIRNLISNAIKFTPNAGIVRVNAVDKNTYVEVKVTDNGIGINPQNMDKLFKIEESYSIKGTHNEEGTGIGLLICKEFIDRHDEKIWVESLEGLGSEFIFTLKKATIHTN